jgi:hypothetical protein
MCHEWFGLEVTNISPSDGTSFSFDFHFAVQTELDCEDVVGRDIFGLASNLDLGDTNNSPVIVVCHSPEEAYHMYFKDSDALKYSSSMERRY